MKITDLTIDHGSRRLSFCVEEGKDSIYGTMKIDGSHELFFTAYEAEVIRDAFAACAKILRMVRIEQQVSR